MKYLACIQPCSLGHQPDLSPERLTLHLSGIFLCVILGACSNQATVIQTDLRSQSGVYLVGYSTEPDARIEFENQLRSDLVKGGMVAHASHEDIPNILASDAEEVFRFAKERSVVAIVVINQVKDNAIRDGRRAQVDAPTVRAFFRSAEAVHSREIAPGSTDVFAEVNAYTIDGNAAALSWSGVTATFQPTSRSQAISDLSATVAKALQDAQRRLRSTY